MKNAIVALSLLMILAACGSKNSGGNNPPPNVNQNGYAAVDLPAECGGPQQNQFPQDYQNAGCSPYNWDTRGHFRRGGCSGDTYAACAPGVGMICVPQNTWRNYNVAWYQYNDGNRQMSFCGYEGRANPGSCAYRTVPGAGTIGRACVLGGVNECGYGHCQPLDVRAERPRRNNRGRNRGAPSVSRAAIGICVQ